MLCPSCDHQNREEATFCEKCSAPFVDATLVTRGKGNSPDRLAGGIFVGRDQEMKELLAGLEDALSGRGQLLMLVGEPGIGKTRTADELAMYARLRGAQVFIGRCYEGEGAPAFWPWVQIVRSYVHGCDLKVLTAEMGPGAADIAQVVAEVRERLPDLPIPPALEPEHARFRLFDSITTFLKNVTNRQPLVLILDDLHWADKPSLLLLQFLAREIEGARLLVVGAYRDVELKRHHPLSQTLGELARNRLSQRIFLQGLTESDIVHFIEISAGLKPPQALVVAVHKETEGNPFFVSEIVRLLVREGRLDRLEKEACWSLSIPQSVREVISRRLSYLSEECNRILTIASLIGREFNLDSLEGVSGLSNDRLLDVLEEAMTTRIIAEVSHAAGHYRFSHTLIRETLYEELSSARRVRLHRQIGEVLESLYEAQPGPHLAELAYHFFQAAPGGNLDKAIAYAVRAAERSIRLLAYEEAVGHYERALQALQLQDAEDETQRCQLLLALGDAQTKAGNIPQARETFQRAAESAKRLRAPELLAHAALGFGEAGVQTGIVDQLLVSLLEQALDALGEGDSVLRAKALARLARELYFSAAVERKELLSRQAIETARRVGDREAIMAALQSRHLVLSGLGDIADRLAIATEMVRLAEEADERVWALQGHEWRLIDMLELGDLSAVDLEIAAFARLAEGLRQPLYLYFLKLFQVMRALLEGRFEEAERLAQQALTTGQRVDSHTAANYFGAQIFRLRREQGRLQELEAVIKGLVDQYPRVPAWRCGLASLYRELKRETEARGEFERLAANDFADLPRDNTWLVGMTVLSEVCAFLRDASRAATLYEFLLPYAGRNVVTGQAAVCDGSVSHYLGLLAATMARWEEAEQHFENALKMHATMGARPLLARTRNEYAVMLLARGQPGDREKALELLHWALGGAQELEMKGLEDKIKLTIANAQSPENSQRGTSRRRLADGSPQKEGAGLNAHHPLPNIFRQEGEYWTLSYEGKVCRLKNAKGLHYIAFLLRHAGEEFHVLELETAMNKRRVAPVTTPYDALSEEQLAEHNLSIGRLGDAGAVLDAQAKSVYRRRLDELQEELEEARRFNDPTRVAKVQEEIEFLTDELAAAIGLGGRDRKAASAAERARLKVTKAVKAALRKISENHPALGYNLTASIKTGAFCSYMPSPVRPIVWVLT